MKYNNKEIYLKPVTDGFSWYDLESNLPLFRRTFKDTNEANVDLEKYIEFEKTIDKKLDILYRQILSSGLDSWSITLLTNQLGKISESLSKRLSDNISLIRTDLEINEIQKHFDNMDGKQARKTGDNQKI